MTSKRARHVSGKGAVWHMSSEQATLAKMPKYNGYAKYHRAKSKRAWKAQMQKEGASRGSFLIVGYVLRGVCDFSCRSSSY